MGGVGQEYVQSVLSTTEPAAAVATIQRQAGLPDARTRPLLQLLDQLGRSRWASPESRAFCTAAQMTISCWTSWAAAGGCHRNDGLCAAA